MSTTARHNQQIIEWNQTATAYPRTRTVHGLFEEQAAKTPDAIAVDYDGITLDYAQLNRLANQLAHSLRKKGVGPEVIVGLFMERSLEMVVGLLGILKAGGAYVPIDPDYPPQRLAFILEDTSAPVLLTQSNLLEKVSGYSGRSLCLDTEVQELKQQGAENPEVPNQAKDLAYVIYTSGSTGEPKGVEIAHGGLTNLVSWHCRAYQVTPADRATHLAGLGFDATVWELWPYLCAGASIYLVPDEQRLSPASLWPWMASRGITLSFMPTPLAESALREPLPSDLSLRVLLTGGDRLHSGIINKELPFSVVNHYGPTENTVVATCAEVDLLAKEDPPIGRPIDNVTTYILDQYQRPVPVGVPGELYIGGDGLALGYLNRPELTKEKFVPNPFAETSNERLYRTGDIARYREDGAIDFIGRIDHQVKLRGYRIEPGEIEAVLNRQSGIESSVVIVREDEPGDKQLVAYIVAENNDVPSVAQLRTFARESLPEYMVPAAFVLMDALPLTPNGKIDRNALPEPDAGRSQLSSDYQAPRTPFESALATIWQQVLKVEHIGINDNFFELGGDSITGAVLTNALQDELGVKLYVVALFDAPTIAEQIAYLKEYFPVAMAVKVEGGHDPGVERSSSGIISQPEAEPINPRDVEDFGKLAASWHRGNNKIEQWRRSDNPQMTYILTTPRSGSSLLRIMLAGHPQLFAPPELELLSYDSLQQRRNRLSGGIDFMREGLVRAVMELKSCDADEAQQIVSEYETRDESVPVFHRLLLEWVGDRMLVDKSATYSMSPQALLRAERSCEDNLYIHLVRHPIGTIRSFEEARLDRVLKFQGQHQYTVRQYAELLWIVSHQNILEFLSKVPKQRQLQIRFEDLVRNPQAAIESICDLLNIDFEPLMLEPYRQQEHRMTDGINARSVGMTDAKFHQHSGIEAGIADAWKQDIDTDFLSEEAWRLAGLFGYERLLKDSDIAPDNGQPAVLRPGADEVDQLSDEEVDRRLQAMLAARRTS